jgi:hypothetical protein
MTQKYEGISTEFAEIIAAASRHLGIHPKNLHARVSTVEKNGERYMECNRCDWRSGPVTRQMSKRALCGVAFVPSMPGPRMTCTRPLYHQGEHAATVVFDEA